LRRAAFNGCRQGLALDREDQAGGGAMGIEFAAGIIDMAFRGTDLASHIHDLAHAEYRADAV